MEVPYQMKEVFLSYAFSFLYQGVPYIWGSNSRFGVNGGLDCSGFVCEVLRSVTPTVRDNTAHGLFTYYVVEGNQLFNKDRPQRGDLLFFGTYDRITHVAIALNQYQMLEAGGGGRTCKSPDEAHRLNAGVRIRMVDSRRDFYTASTIF